MNLLCTLFAFLSRRSLWKSCVAVLVMGALLAESAFSTEGKMAAKWSLLTYSPNVAGMGGGELQISVMPWVNDIFPKAKNRAGFRVNFSWIVRDGSMDRDGDVEAFKRLKLRLHYPDGRVVEPTHDSGLSLVTAGVLVAARFFTFPYGDDAPKEAWFELRTDDRTYWLEVPYGFTRNPENPLSPWDPNAKDSPYAPAMFQMKKDDDIVRWNDIQYRFGAIQNDWGLLVNFANRGAVRCQVKLRRREGRWTIQTPVITVKLEKDKAGTVVGEQISSRLESPTCREDEFEFDFKQLAGRGWADLTVTVDGVSQSRVVSSGIFLEGMWIPPSSR